MDTVYQPAWNGEPPPPAPQCWRCRHFTPSSPGYGVCGIIADATLITLGLTGAVLDDIQVEIAEDFGCRHWESKALVNLPGG